MTYRGPWNAARWRHGQQPRKYKSVGAMGEPVDWNQPGLSGEQACNGCGRHVCSCEKPKGDISRIEGTKVTISVSDVDMAALLADMQPVPSEQCSVDYIRADGSARVNIGNRVFLISPRCGVYEQTSTHIVQVGHPESLRAINLIDGAAKHAAAAHRASMPPQTEWRGGTASERRCDHSGIGLPECQICDPIAKARDNLRAWHTSCYWVTKS